MLNSFIYMFKLKGFVEKYLSLLGILFIANVLINWSSAFSAIYHNGVFSPWYYILFILGFVVMFIPYGYSISLLKSRLENNPENDLPEMNIIQNFVSGLKVVLSGAILIILLVIFVYLTFFITNLIYLKFNFIDVISSVILLFAAFVVSFFGISMCCRYVIKPSVFNFVNFKAAAELINADVTKYFKSYVAVVISTIIIYSIAILSSLFFTKIGYTGLILYCILVSVLWAYQTFVLADLFRNAVIAEKI